MSVYAVGIKGYIELRESPKPPVTRVTVATKEVPDDRSRWHEEVDQWGRHYYRSGKLVKRRLTGIITKGGRFLTSMKVRRFSDVTRIHVLPGGVWEVPPEHLPKLLKELPERPAKMG